MRTALFLFVLCATACDTSNKTADNTPATTNTVTGAAMNAAPNNVPAVVANNPGAHDQGPNADNTKINDRDRQNTLTPVDQGNSAAETNVTAAIRKSLMADSSLSTTAKNVKVITVGSKVTLRGPVMSDQEKTSIESHAKQAAGVTAVDDQLEVKKQ